MSAEDIRSIAKSNDAIAANYTPPPMFADMPNMKGKIIVTCMDPRSDPKDFWNTGDFPIIRNVGGIVTEDTLRSIRFLSGIMSNGRNTVGVVAVVHHTDCGLYCFSDHEVREGLKKQAKLEGERARELDSVVFESWKGGITLEDTVKRDMKTIKSDPYLPKELEVVGYVYDVVTGKTTEVEGF